MPKLTTEEFKEGLNLTTPKVVMYERKGVGVDIYKNPTVLVVLQYDTLSILLYEDHGISRVIPMGIDDIKSIECEGGNYYLREDDMMLSFYMTLEGVCVLSGAFSEAGFVPVKD